MQHVLCKQGEDKVSNNRIFMFSRAIVIMALVSETHFTKAQELTVSERDGKRLFTKETFGGNGRTCTTCHSLETGTVSPEDAQERLRKDFHDPLFAFDGSDDGLGNGFSRMLTDATILVKIALPPNVRVADDPAARFVVVRRGIPTTHNTP